MRRMLYNLQIRCSKVQIGGETMDNKEKILNLKINGMEVSVPEGTTILEAARKVNVEIPTLCYLKEINEIGACRICVVEVGKGGKLAAACVQPVSEGMDIYTNSLRVQEARRLTLEMILSTHDKDCLSCVRSGNCELQELCHDFGIADTERYKGEMIQYENDDSAVHMIRDNNKCILCRRCIAVCNAQHIGVIGTNGRGFDTHVSCAMEKDLGQVPCISCGQCIVNCPTGALSEKDETDKVWAALDDPEKFVVVNTAPSIRAILGECFDMEIGTDVKGKMVSALRRLGFDRVFDTDFGADLTIMEEATELLDRIQNGGALPMITSCSPGWVTFCETYYPEFIPNLSSCKSPQQMLGAVTKTWYAEKEGIDPKNIVVVGIMPCTAKKAENLKGHYALKDIPDVDVSLTTRELGRMIKRAHINFKDLPDEEFDPTLGESTGAGTIFGATGGVMEAALRTAAEWIEGKPLESLDFHEVRGIANIKEATYTLGGKELRVAVVSGTGYADELLKRVKAGEAHYDFIEIMGCPGGCVNGGGQPVQHAVVRNFHDLRALRAKVLYNQDKGFKKRKSHENAAVNKLYDEYLGKPGSEKAHHILHTAYKAREKYM